MSLYLLICDEYFLQDICRLESIGDPMKGLFFIHFRVANIPVQYKFLHQLVKKLSLLFKNST